MHLCSTRKKWDAGFVNEHAFVEFLNEKKLSDWKWGRPVLIVVDNANGYASRGLGKWISYLENTHPMPKYPLRLVLVDRTASLDDGWLKQVKDDSEFSISKRSILDLSTSTSQLSIQNRVEIFSEMVNFFGSSMPKNKYEDRELLRQLEKASWGNDPLYIMMAAMRWTDASENQKETLSLNSLALSKYVAGIEKIRFDRTAKSRGLNQIMLTHLAAFVTLVDGDRKGIGQKEFFDLIPKEEQALQKIIGPSFETQRLEYFNALKTLLPQSSNDDKRLHGILPDVIGETFVMNTIDGNEIDDQMALRSYNLSSNGTIQTLIRIVQDFETEWSLNHLNTIFNSIQNDPIKLSELAYALPYPTQILAKFSLDTYKRLSNILESMAPNDQNILTTSRILNNLGNRLEALDYHNEALKVTQKAVDLYRELASENPDDYNLDLARGLNNLGIRFYSLKRYEEAIKATRESMQLYIASSKTPGAYDSEIVMVFANLASFLENAGKHEAALEMTQVVVDLYRDLVSKNPDNFNPYLAAVLNNQAVILSDLERYDEALEKMEEALGLYCDLAIENPNTYNFTLSCGFNNLGSILSKLDRYDEALKVTQEAVKIRRALAAKNPDAYNSELALSLGNIGYNLENLGHYEEALEAAVEALGLYRQFAKKYPLRFNKDVLSVKNLINSIQRKRILKNLCMRFIEKNL